MQALITGGAGFIGSHLAEALLTRGHEVAVIDDLSTGAIDNIEHLKGTPGFTYTIDSIFNRSLMTELADPADVIFHLAAAVGVRLIVESPVRTIETNVRGTEVVLDVAAKKKKKVVVSSTSEVYGKRNQVPFREDDDLILGPPTRGRWSYGCSKALDEFLALAYWREKGVPVVILRLFNTVGPRQTGRYGMVVPTFVRQAMAGEPITVYGDGKQSRCFSYVADVVKVMTKLADHPDAVGEIFNVGSSDEVTIGDLASKVKEITHSSSEITYVPYDVAYEAGFEDMQRRVPDLTKVRRLAGDGPGTSLTTLLERVVQHFRMTASAPRRDRAPAQPGRTAQWAPVAGEHGLAGAEGELGGGRA